MIIEAHYRASKTLYALKNDSFVVGFYPMEPKKPAYATVEAIWTSTKQGITSVSLGTLRYSPNASTPREITLENMLAHFDTRYGGDVKVRWDGDYMFAPTKTLAEMNEYAEILDPILRNIPTIPDNYSGWYMLVQGSKQ